MELIWENLAPTDNFSTQTINLDLTNYNGVVIKSKFHKTSSGINLTEIYIPKNETRYIVVNGSDTMSPTSSQFSSRQVTVSGNGVTFKSGCNLMITNTNDYCIPLEIYGL